MAWLILIRRLHQHRSWVNEALLATAEELTSDQLQQRFEIGQGSVWRTLTHLFGAEYVWLEGLQGNENPVAPGDVPGKLPGNHEGENPITSMADLCSRWKDLETQWDAYLESLNADSLLEDVYKISSSSGNRSATQRSDILLHVCTHAQYTTAQLMNMLRHLGVKQLPDPMLITMARQSG